MKRTHILAMVSLAATIALPACQAAPRARPVEMGPVGKGPGTLAAARKYLEGHWQLESLVFYPPGKPSATLRGTGTLTYDEFSNLSMVLRPDPADAEALRSAGFDVPESGTITTQGRTAVDVQNHTLTYVVEGRDPGLGPLALNRTRYWQVDGNILTLTTKDADGKPLTVGRWKKDVPK